MRLLGLALVLTLIGIVSGAGVRWLRAGRGSRLSEPYLRDLRWSPTGEAIT